MLIGFNNNSTISANSKTSPNNVNINQNLKYIKIRPDIVHKHNNIDSTGSRSDVIGSVIIWKNTYSLNRS